MLSSDWILHILYSISDIENNVIKISSNKVEVENIVRDFKTNYKDEKCKFEYLKLLFKCIDDESFFSAIVYLLKSCDGSVTNPFFALFPIDSFEIPLTCSSVNLFADFSKLSPSQYTDCILTCLTLLTKLLVPAILWEYCSRLANQKVHQQSLSGFSYVFNEMKHTISNYEVSIPWGVIDSLVCNIEFNSNELKNVFELNKEPQHQMDQTLLTKYIDMSLNSVSLGNLNGASEVLPFTIYDVKKNDMSRFRSMHLDSTERNLFQIVILCLRIIQTHYSCISSINLACSSFGISYKILMGFFFSVTNKNFVLFEKCFCNDNEAISSEYQLPVDDMLMTELINAIKCVQLKQSFNTYTIPNLFSNFFMDLNKTLVLNEFLSRCESELLVRPLLSYAGLYSLEPKK